jgi:hypothetical protein
LLYSIVTILIERKTYLIFSFMLVVIHTCFVVILKDLDTFIDVILQTTQLNNKGSNNIRWSWVPFPNSRFTLNEKRGVHINITLTYTKKVIRFSLNISLILDRNYIFVTHSCCMSPSNYCLYFMSILFYMYI